MDPHRASAHSSILWNVIQICFCSHFFEHRENHTDFFFGPELERNRINWDRSPVRIFLSTVERRLTADRSNQISVRRVIATTSCITHGLKTVSPSKNPCDSDPFFGRKLTIEHQRCQIVRLQETHIIQIFLFALLRASSNLVAFMRTRIGYLFRAGAQTESHKEDICCLFFYLPPSVDLLLTVRARLSVRAIAYEKSSSLLSIGSLEQFWNAITLELRASLLAGGLHFRFFNVCLVLHGLY